MTLSRRLGDMYKAIIISTSGSTTVEGNKPYVMDAIKQMEGAYSYAFVYKPDGFLEKAFKAKHYNPIEENFF